MIKSKKNRGLFDEHFRYEKLTRQNDPFLKISGHIDWSIFRLIIERIYQKEEANRKGGRTRYDYTLMFKILILQR